MFRAAYHTPVSRARHMVVGCSAMNPLRSAPQRPLLLFALSGLGKSALCERFPDVTYDTDTALDSALAALFPDEAPSRRRVSWRALTRSTPWGDHATPAFRHWASARRRMVSEILGQLRRERPVLVLTNMMLVPWPYAAYYGLELGTYEEHWASLARVADNDQVESRNNKLEGFAPLVRMKPGEFLSDRPEIVGWLERAASEADGR